VTSLRGTTFTWTRDGTLREADDPIPAAPEAYGVDSRSRRFSRIVSGTAQEYYVYEGLDRVAVVGPNGVDQFGSAIAGPVLESYLFDGIDHPLRIARPGVASTNYYYYEVDLAGNVRGLRASGGASLGGYRYSAFGQAVEDTSLINQPLRWKARWFSPVANGIYDVRARQWSPELGTFLSIDELDYHDVKSTLWGWPNQSPARFSDTTGHYLDNKCKAQVKQGCAQGCRSTCGGALDTACQKTCELLAASIESAFPGSICNNDPPHTPAQDCLAESEAVFFACFLTRNEPEIVCYKEQIAYYNRCLAGKAAN
jgi:RHS repeat-associated protein